MADQDECGISDALVNFQHNCYFVAYYVIMPFYFIIGVSGNVTLLAAFYKQSKYDAAYAYQVTLTLSKSLEVFNFSMFFFAYKWCAAVESPDGCTWFMKNYPLMFYAAHVSCPIFNSFIIISLFLSVAMSADRVFALAKPFVYKNINHKKHHLIATGVCFLLGILTNLYEVDRWHVFWPRGMNPANETYVIRYDEDYLATPLATVLGHVRSSFRIVAVIALVSLNIAMAVIFRKRNQKVAEFGGKDRKDKERKAAEKTLLVLTVYQSVLTALSQIPHAGWAIVAAAFPFFNHCYGFLFFPFIDMLIEITDAADFFVILAINKRMRKVILQVLPCKFACGQTGDTRAIATSTAQATSVHRQNA